MARINKNHSRRHLASERILIYLDFRELQSIENPLQRVTEFRCLYQHIRRGLSVESTGI